jgi:hypothetical protein
MGIHDLGISRSDIYNLASLLLEVGSSHALVHRTTLTLYVDSWRGSQQWNLDCLLEVGLHTSHVESINSSGSNHGRKKAGVCELCVGPMVGLCLTHIICAQT